MSRLLVIFCTIFVVYRHHVVISYVLKIDFASALKMRKYTAILEKISILESSRMKGYHDRDVNTLNNAVKSIQEIIVDVNEMIKIYGIAGKTLNTSALQFPLNTRVNKQFRDFRLNLVTHNITNIIFSKSNDSEEYVSKLIDDYVIMNQIYFKKSINQSKLKKIIPVNHSEDRIDRYLTLESHLDPVFHIMILELKSYLMHAYALFLQRSYSFYHQEFKYFEYNPDRMSMIYSNINMYRQAISQYLLKSTEPLRGEETLELDGNFQRFIALEPDMDHNGGCSFAECNLAPSGLLQSEFQLDGYYRTKPCRGKLTSCKSVSEIQICYANDSSLKRYEGFKLDDKINGNMDSCPGGKYTISSWRRWFAIVCDVCLCTCIETSRDKKRTQVISYAEQTSDIENNMVVTNVRFVEKNKAIYIQIEEKSLWSIKFNNVTTRHSWKSITVNNEELKQVRDMQRCMDLYKAFVPRGCVVTGVKFGAYTPEGGLVHGAYHQFQIHVHATPYDETENKLITSEFGESTSYWIDPNLASPHIRDFFRDRTAVRSFNIEDLYDPSPIDRITDSVKNQYMCFRASDLQDDGGQSTIPYFDKRPTTSLRPLPLIGVGISLKGYGGSKGYLTLKTFHYSLDFTS